MLSKAYCDESRSLWYNNGRTKSKLSMASRNFTIDTRWNLMNYTMSLPSTISNGFHSYIRILTHTKKLFARLQVELWQRSCGYPYNDGPINGGLQSKNKWYQSKDKLFEWHLKWNSLYGARWRTETTKQRGGSEWEPIKILLERDRGSNKMNVRWWDLDSPRGC
jgi:hypothetical protein